MVDTLLNQIQNEDNVSLQIREGQPEYLINQLTLGNVDHLIISGPVKEASLESHKLGTESFKLAVPASWEFDDRGTLDTEELSDRQFLSLKEGHSYRGKVPSLIKPAGSRPDFTYRGNCLHKLIEFVGNEVGYTVLPELFAKKVNRPDVSFFDFEGYSPSRDILHVRRQSGYQNKLTEWFTTEASQWFSN